MNAIKQLIEKSCKTPVLAAVYALELDRLLRGMGQAPLTFSANGVADANDSTAKALGLSQLFEAQSGTPTHTGGNLYQAEILVKEGKRSEAIAHAFAHAQGPEINALNLLYANHATSNPKLRLYFLNKYLDAFGLEIELEEGAARDFFHKIKSAQTGAKVDGQLVTVIMPAHNAERTIELALGSLLNQTWQNLQIIVVDDASTDATLQKAKDLAKRDPRVEVLSSPVNVGPYVCRNLGVLHTRGQWLTVHDADDWAFPDRIEQQVQALTAGNALACTGRMLRMNEQGQITRPIAGTSATEDGYLRLCFVSLMVQTAYFRKELGAWDSVRVGGDAELIERLKVLGTHTKHLRHPLMLCLDHEAGLTNDQAFGLSDETGQTHPLRADYKRALTTWHQAAGPKKMPAFGQARPFDAPKANLVEPGAIKKVFAIFKKNLDSFKNSKNLNANSFECQTDELTQELSRENRLSVSMPSEVDVSNSYFKKNTFGNERHEDAAKAKHRIKAVNLAKGNDGIYGGKTGVLVGDSSRHSQSESTHILNANAALGQGDELEWINHLNSYLAQFNAGPILLEDRPGSIFDRLGTPQSSRVTNGPLISVIMPAWNSEKTIRNAAISILNQTWRNIELLIIDDASTDCTWAVIQEIANADDRVKIFRNLFNIGPYASKNIALQYAKGDWITGHDADDFALPNRLELHLKRMLNDGALVSTLAKIRILENGMVKISKTTKDSDGVSGQAFISCLYKADFLKNKLGGWDSVRFGADGEIINRVKTFFADKFRYYSDVISMICLDLPDGLTNNQIFGITSAGLSEPRRMYLDNYKKWHKRLTSDNFSIEFPMNIRPFPCHKSAEAPFLKIIENLHSLNSRN